MSGFLFKFKNLPHATKNRLSAQLQVLFEVPVLEVLVSEGVRQLPTFIVTGRKAHDLEGWVIYC
jgi:hypothetical protein